MAINIIVGFGAHPLEKNTSHVLQGVVCRSAECPPGIQCTFSGAVVDVTSVSKVEVTGEASTDIYAAKGADDTVELTGDAFEHVGTLALGTVTLDRTSETPVDDQIIDRVFDAVAEHLEAGRCLVKLTQE